MAYRLTPVDWKEPSPQVEAGIERQACPGLCRFHEAEQESIFNLISLLYLCNGKQRNKL